MKIFKFVPFNNEFSKENIKTKINNFPGFKEYLSYISILPHDKDEIYLSFDKALSYDQELYEGCSVRPDCDDKFGALIVEYNLTDSEIENLFKDLIIDNQKPLKSYYFIWSDSTNKLEFVEDETYHY